MSCCCIHKFTLSPFQSMVFCLLNLHQHNVPSLITNKVWISLFSYSPAIKSRLLGEYLFCLIFVLTMKINVYKFFHDSMVPPSPFYVKTFFKKSCLVYKILRYTRVSPISWRSKETRYYINLGFSVSLTAIAVKPYLSLREERKIRKTYSLLLSHVINMIVCFLSKRQTYFLLGQNAGKEKKGRRHRV